MEVADLELSDALRYNRYLIMSPKKIIIDTECVREMGSADELIVLAPELTTFLPSFLPLPRCVAPCC